MDYFIQCVCYLNSGASEMLMANAVSQLAAKTPGKEAIAIEAFAKALRMVSNIFLLKVSIYIYIYFLTLLHRSMGLK